MRRRSLWAIVAVVAAIRGQPAHATNLLTNPALDPFGKIPEFKFCAARIAAA